MGSYAYDKENTYFLGVKLNKKTDADIIAILESQKNRQLYIKDLIRADIAAHATSENHSKLKGETNMKSISIDNGASYVTPQEALESVSIETMVEYMDDDTREQVSNELAPCSDVEFLTRYLELAPCDLVIG